MRDIVTAGYNHTPKTSGGLNTKTVTYSEIFEENYNKTSKDDTESVSSNDSGVSSYKLLESKSNNTSTSSLNSEAVFSKVENASSFLGGNRTGSFRHYLDNYSSKKFNSVKPAVAAKPKTIKSEIVIQLECPNGNNLAPEGCQTNFVTQKPPIAINPVKQPQTLQVKPPPSPTQTTPVNLTPPQLNQDSLVPPPPPPPPLPDLSKVSPKQWSSVQTTPTPPNHQPKIPKDNSPAANLAKILNEHVLARRKLSDPEQAQAATLPRLPPKSHSTPKNTRVLPKLPTSLPRVQRCHVDTVDFCTTTVVPVVDGTSTVSKGDPNVKKLVYNTYRGLLGAYNNKANDMIATLPRKMVTEDKGVSKQVESISLQCRLDKLNGRINPKLEQE